MWRPEKTSQKSLLSSYHVEGTQVIRFGGVFTPSEPSHQAKFYVINNKRNIWYRVVICSMYEASHPALSVEPVRSAESKVHLGPVVSGPDVLNKALGSLCAWFERSLVCTGWLDGAAVWLPSSCSSLRPSCNWLSFREAEVTTLGCSLSWPVTGAWESVLSDFRSWN